MSIQAASPGRAQLLYNSRRLPLLTAAPTSPQTPGTRSSSADLPSGHGPRDGLRPARVRARCRSTDTTQPASAALDDGLVGRRFYAKSGLAALLCYQLSGVPRDLFDVETVRPVTPDPYRLVFASRDYPPAVCTDGHAPKSHLRAH